MSEQDNMIMETDSELDVAMKLLDEEIVEVTQNEDLEEEAPSPTLTDLEAARRPKVKTACEICPNSMWLSSPEDVKCYCRIMHTISWSAKEPSLITKCDGVFLD